MRQDDGVDGDAQRLSQLVWMIFLKVLDDNEQELEQLNKGYVAAVPKEFQWRTWAANEEGLTGSSLLDFVNNKLFPGLKQLPQSKANLRNEIVRGVFEDSHNYMKNGTLLRQVANKINTINFNAKSDRHSFNDIYETLLKSLQSAGNSGEYYTPRPVTEFITEMVDPQFGEAVLDPACGTGGFLANAIEHIRKQVKTPEDERVLGDSIRGVRRSNYRTFSARLI
jgi:type I restriction enzyme M protein